MLRKLIKQGSGGFTIYLPKKWVDKQGFSEGQTVELFETHNGILVEPPIKHKKTISIKYSQTINIKTILTHIYRRGFDQITITNLPKKESSKLRKQVRDYLLGFEVTSIEDSSCTIEGVSEPSEEKYENLLRRAFLIIKETQNIVHEDLNTGKYQNETTINELTVQQEKFILFCRRILNKQSEKKSPVIEWELLTFLMHIEHAYKYLYKSALENNPTISKETKELLKELENYFSLYYDAFYKRNTSKIYSIDKKKQELQFGKCYKLLAKSKGSQTIILSHIRELFRLIQIGASPILSYLIDTQEQ